MRAYLAVMAVAALLPLIVVSAVVLDMLLRAERDAAIRGVRETGRAVSLAVDQELASAETALRVLGNSSFLNSGELARFYEQAMAARTTEAAWILLFDRDGRLLFNTRFPYGTALKQRPDPERIQRVAEAGRPHVSGLFRGTNVQRLIVTVDVPVTGRDGTRYVISQAFDAGYFEHVVAARRIPPSWIVGIFDAEHLTIARSHKSDEVGKPGAEMIRQSAQSANEGEIRHSSRDGIDIYDVFTHSARSNWLVAVGVPAAELDAHAQRAVAVVGIGALVAIVLAAAIAYLLARRLGNSVATIAASAAALGRGEALPPYAASFREIDGVRAALEEAHAVLERETEGRELAEAERLRLFESEQAARELAETENRSKDEFLAMLGHELRNPLSAISGAVALMRAPAAREEHRLHARDVITRQVQHLSRVVDDLLDLSRVMTGKIALEFAPIDLAQATNTCLSTMRAAGRAGDHDLKARLEPVWVNADATRLEQIIGNLLSNAFKYTPPEGRIELTVSAQDDDAVLSVRDSGLGISKRLLPHVFDVFVQGDQSLERAKGGLGIGLALVQRLVILHGGTVQAESAGDGRGSLFTVRLPSIAAPSAAGASVTGALPALRKLRVLVVDDHDDSRTMLKLLLEQTGHEAIEAVDGIDGVQLALSRRPDVAIIDIGLPGISGYEVARRLRALPTRGRIPLIALTGYGQDEDRRRALQAGFDLHLVKPVEAERLTQALMEVTRLADPGGQTA
jgi:signal transduction histidine kinase/ActR/RegA family two-component response regulator